MVFVDESWRACRSPPVINSKCPAIVIPEHRAKTPRTKEKEEKNWEQLLPKTPFPPPHSDETLSFARQRRFFYFTLASGRNYAVHGSTDLRNFSLEKLGLFSHFF